jgi:hypothetical protein
MFKPKLITVTMRELDRLKTVQAVLDGQMRPGVAAARLEITDRQFRRLMERYCQTTEKCQRLFPGPQRKRPLPVDLFLSIPFDSIRTTFNNLTEFCQQHAI